MNIDFGQSIQGMLDTTAAVLPQILAFVAILIVGWIIAKVIRKVVSKVLEKVRFNKIAERGVVGDALGRSNYSASSLIAAICYYAILLITLQLAFGVFGPNSISVLLASVVAWLPKLAVAIIIVVVASAIAKVVKDLIEGALGGTSYGKTLATIASVFILALGAIAALDQVGIGTAITGPLLIAALATVAGILVVGVGGGLIQPMRGRWESWLGAVERETGTAYDQGRSDALRGAPARHAAEEPSAPSSSL